MIVYSNDRIEKGTEFVSVYSTSGYMHNIMQMDGEEINTWDGKKREEILDKAMTVFLNNHVNDSNLKVTGVFSIREDNNPSELIFIPCSTDFEPHNF